MYKISDLCEAAQQRQAQGHISLDLDSVSFQIYDGKPLQFNATLKGNRFTTIKFEERTPGKFTVAVAPKDGSSIDSTQTRTFDMSEPLEHLAATFKNSDIRQFVDWLIDSN